MENYIYKSIEVVNSDWFIVRYQRTQPTRAYQANQYILVHFDELKQIITYGLDSLFDSYMIISFTSKKSLVERYKSEQMYKHLFE